MNAAKDATHRSGFSLIANDFYGSWIQPVNATDWAKRSAGV
jgi:hypothetical protein